MAEHEEPANTTLSRRSLLKTGAVGAGVAGAAWVTPSVLTMDQALAVGTCPQTLTFPWSSGGNGTRHTGALNPLVANIGGPTGVDIRIVSTAVSGTGVAGAGIVGDNWMTRGATSATYPPQINCGSAATTNWPRGNQGSFYSLLMNNTTAENCNSAGTASRFVEVEFGFYVPGSLVQRYNVRNLTFSLYDVDSAGTYRDRVAVSINGNAVTTPVTLGAANQATATRAVAEALSTITLPGATAVFDAKSNTSSASNSPNGNVQLAFNAGVNVNRVRVRFTDILGAAPTTIQWVGIGNMTFCKFGLA